MEELYHYGIKGQKWGVRRYQYADGSVTPAGAKRYYTNRNEPTIKRVSSLAGMKATELTNMAKTKITGKQYVDTYLKKEPRFKEYRAAKISKILHFMPHTKNQILINIWDCLEKI